MSIRTLLLYLIGNRSAIEQIASSRHALWIGLLFVLSAGFAREYDGEDLIAEPWHALLPVGASLVSSFVLFTILSLRLYLRETPRPSFLSAYRSFLGLFWMTASLAWLYAIPYERFMSAPNSVRANLLTLGIVATWRVVLMVRVAIVLFGYRVRHAAYLVLLFGDALLFAAMRLMPLPVFSLMGGIRLTESESTIQSVTFVVGLIGVCSLPVWMFGAVIVLCFAKPTWRLVTTETIQGQSPRWDLALLAVASVLVWIAVLPFTQGEQQLRHRVEMQLRSGHVREGLADMSSHSRSDFPPHWDPPPRIGYGEKSPDLLDVLETLELEPADDWVREVYFAKLRSCLGELLHPYLGLEDDRRLERLLLFLVRHPSGRDTVAPFHYDLKTLYEQEKRPESVRAAIRLLVTIDERRPVEPKK
jgi:hypothetical protein